jgi:hypothetical protein
MTDRAGDEAEAGQPRALVTGWFSFPYHHATAGDLMACDVVSEWLADARLPHDVALAAPFEGGVDWRSVPVGRYTHLIFVCGPVGPTRSAVIELLERFGTQRRIAVNVTMQEPLEAWNPFDVVVERDSTSTSRPDLSLASERPLVPLVGLILVEPYQPEEFPGRDAQRPATEAIRRLLTGREMAVIPIDTRVDANAGELRSPAEVEAAIARMDAVVTTRLHGMVLALKNGVPALAVDPVAGGSKIRLQAERLGWPIVHTLDALAHEELSRSLEFCLTAEARTLALDCAHRARSELVVTRDEFVGALHLPSQNDVEPVTRPEPHQPHHADDAPVTVVVVATPQGPGLLEACLDSVIACTPRARQTIVAATAEMDAAVVPDGVEIVRSKTRGAALNAALAIASHATVMLIDGDCLASAQFVGVGWKHSLRSPTDLGLGHVLPLEDSRRVPSGLHAPREHTLSPALTWAHMHRDLTVLPRDAVLAAGGFAEADPMDLSLELTHRWERLGRRTQLLPDLVAWRQPWRDQGQLERLAVEQARARGAFYGTLARNGDRGAAAAAIAKEWRAGVRSVLAAARHPRPGWSDPRRGILRGLPSGVVRGLTGPRTRRSA